MKDITNFADTIKLRDQLYLPVPPWSILIVATLGNLSIEIPTSSLHCEFATQHQYQLTRHTTDHSYLQL